MVQSRHSVTQRGRRDVLRERDEHLKHENKEMEINERESGFKSIKDSSAAKHRAV